MADLLRRNEAEALSELAHQVKGASGMMTARPLQEAATRMEAAGKGRDMAGAAEIADLLGQEARRCLEYIPELRKKFSMQTGAVVENKQVGAEVE
jgi:HPt (histidine-containing phosphotransfer) domain-containing protein